MSSLRLSVCIPTYNFGAFIGATLDSIVAQATGEIEIVIVDGASTDDTAHVVQKIGHVFPRLRFYRRDINGGVDVDLAKAVELARGDYCWLMSGDDVLAPRAMERVLDELEEEHDVYLCNRTECDRDLTPITRRPWLARDCRDEVFQFASSADFMGYFRKARSLGALFSYISSIITRRDKWLAVRPDERRAGLVSTEPIHKPGAPHADFRTAVIDGDRTDSVVATRHGSRGRHRHGRVPLSCSYICAARDAGVESL